MKYHLVNIEVLKQDIRNGMGKTAAQILNDTALTNTHYATMKRLLTA